MKRFLSMLLCVAVVFACIPAVSVGADSVIEIFDNDGNQITEKQYLQEYRTAQLKALTPSTGEDGGVTGTELDTSAGNYVEWKSNLPLLANVDETGKVTAYDFSKRAVIQLWIDENIRTLPLVGDATAEAIWKAIDSSGIDLDNADTNTIVGIVSTITGDSLGESLRSYLDNMNVEITATLYDAQGNKIGSDKVEFVIEKSLIASVAPTGVHITNKKVVPTTVAVGATVQLYGACTPVRLGQGVKWSIGSGLLDSESKNHATVSEDGLVTFTSPGTATVKVNPSSTIYGTFSDTITFTIVDRAALPVESFDITGEASVGEGETIKLSVNNVFPAGAYQGDLVWSSSDNAIAVVDENGIVTGLDGGSGLTYSKNVTITATMGGVARSVEIKVTRPLLANISSVEVSGDQSLGIGATSTYTGTVFPERLNTSSSVSREWGIVDAVTGEYISASQNAPAENAVASVSAEGVVTCVGAGVVTIYCKATYNSSSAIGTYQIVCGKAITDFKIYGSASVKECGTSQLYISEINPTDYEAELLKTVVWTISDDSVASISESGLLLGRDAGGRSGSSSRTAVVTATVSGISRSITITVTGQGLIAINKYSDAKIEGNECVIVDIPRQYTLKTYPERIDKSATYWGLQTDEGGAPWVASQTYGGDNRNTENSNASISNEGVLSGKKAGETVVYGFAKNLLSTYIEAKREIDVIEIIPASITLKEPEKTEYIEGVTELDLSGMEVYLNYSREEVGKYYTDAEALTDAQLSAQVTDYTVSELNTSLLDATQFIIVSVERAGKTMNAVFAVTIASKHVSSLSITPEKTIYMEDEEIDFSGLKVVANFLNCESEQVTDYEIDYTSFDSTLYDVEQNVRVVYSHAGRTVEATFPIIIYGYPVITVQSNASSGGWSSTSLGFTLSSTHSLEGVTYYYKNEGSSNWISIAGNECYFFGNRDEVIYFKAVNSAGIESKITQGFNVRIDDVTPIFSTTKSNTSITNQDYEVQLSVEQIGKSGVDSITVNGENVDKTTLSFTVSRNGEYTVILTAGNGLTCEKTVVVNNIDKQAPGITEVKLFQEADLPSRETEGVFGLYFSGDVFATVEAEDSGVAGISHLMYRLVDKQYNPISDWVEIMPEQTGVCNSQFVGYFEFVAVDKAGNLSSSTYSNGFTRDSVKPVITSLNAVYGDKEYTSGFWSDSIVELTPQADAFSGVYEFIYSLNGGPWVKLDTQTLTVLTEGVHNYSFKAISYSGLESDAYEITVNIDRTAPIIRVDFEGTFGRWTNEAVTFTLGTLNSCPSGCTYYYNCGQGWVKLDSNVARLTESTNAYYRFKAVNGAGLESAESDSYLVMIDNVKPNAQIIKAVEGKTDAPYDIVVVPVTGEAGTNKVYFNGEDITENLTYTVSENGKYMLTIIGNNMLSSTIAVEITNFSVIPSVSFTYEKLDEDTIKITGYSGNARNVTIPFEIDGYTVVELSSNVFNGNTLVESINVAPTVEIIGENCFANCPALKKVTICEAMVAMDYSAFDASPNVVLYCYEDTEAMYFALTTGIDYVLLGVSPKGKTIINDEAAMIFTAQTNITFFGDIISAEGYTVMAVPSLMPSEGIQFFGTGSLLYLFRGGRLEKTYTLIVYGDVDSDSVVDGLDVFMVQKAHTGAIELTDEYLLSADVNSSGFVDAGDYQQIINIALK